MTSTRAHSSIERRNPRTGAAMTHATFEPGSVGCLQRVFRPLSLLASPASTGRDAIPSLSRGSGSAGLLRGLAARID